MDRGLLEILQKKIQSLEAQRDSILMKNTSVISENERELKKLKDKLKEVSLGLL